VAARVCIDGFNISLKRGSGVATYGRNLLSCLKALGYETQILYGPQRQLKINPLLSEVSLFDASPAPTLWSQLTGSLNWLSPPRARQARRVEQTGVVMLRQLAQRAPPVDVHWSSPNVFHRANRAYVTWKGMTPVRLGGGEAGAPQVMHWTCPLPMRAPGAANIYTFHDIVPLRLPYATLDNKRRFHALCQRLLRTADHAVAVSEATRQDLIRVFGVPEDRISVTYQSADLARYVDPKSDEEAAREVQGVFNLDWRGYFLFFGGIEPKKNLPRIVEAYLASGSKTPLILVGGHGWLDDDELRLLHPDLVEMTALRDQLLRREDRIRRYDYLPIALLVSLIRGAKATLFPSIYEGFGLPVLESMQLGTPVLTSTAGSLPEVAGEAALSVDPYDALAIRRGIEALDADEGLRDELSAKGRVQAARFSPQAHQRRLADVYRRFV
jgi:glycosyltransferase involved in cell wall biosynthesis